MATLDSLPRQTMLSVLRDCGKHFYVVQISQNKKGQIESSFRTKQEAYNKKIRTLKIIYIFLGSLTFQFPFGIGVAIGLVAGQPVLCVLGPIFAGISIFFAVKLYKKIKRKKQKELANELNLLQPYVPFCNQVLNKAIEECNNFCQINNIPKVLQSYEAASYVYAELAASATLPLYTAIEHYRNQVHREAMESYAYEQNQIAKQMQAEANEHYQRMEEEAARNNELLRNGVQNLNDIKQKMYYG